MEQKRLRKCVIVLTACFALSICMGCGVRRFRVRKLERQVDQLETRIEQLEQKTK